MKHLLPLSLLVLGACTTTTQDSQEPGVASLTMSYSWADFVPAATDCQSAYAESLWIDMEHSSGGTRLVSAPCDDDPALIQDLPVGAWILELRTTQDPDTTTSIWATSPITDLSLVDGENSVELVLSCQDRCGE